MIAEAAQAAQEAAKSSASIVLDAGVIGLVVTNVFVLARDWMKARAARQQARDAADEAEAKALQAQAVAIRDGKTGANGNGGNGIHEKYVLPHSLKLQELDGKVQVMDQRMSKFEVENTAQHGKIFDRLDDIKDLIIGKSSGAA